MLLMGLFWEEKIGIARRTARASKLKQILGNVRCKNVDHTLGLAHQDVAMAMGMAENAGDSHDAPYSLAEQSTPAFPVVLGIAVALATTPTSLQLYPYASF